MSKNFLDPSAPIIGVPQLLQSISWDDLQVVAKTIIEESFPELRGVQIVGGSNHDYLNFCLSVSWYDIFITEVGDTCWVKVNVRASTKPYYTQGLLLRNLVAGLLRGLVTAHFNKSPL